MTTAWIIRALAAGVLLAAAAVFAERIAGWFGAPRRWTWAAAMAGTLLLPLAALVAPGLFPRMDAADAPVAAAPSATATGETADVAPDASRGAPPLPLGRIFVLGWMTASAAMLAVLGLSCRRVNRALRGMPGARLHGVRVRVAERAGPATVGILMPEILVPRWVLDAPDAEARLIVLHEREHAAAGDVRLLALATLALAAMPWNPALWWQHRRLRLAVETDCDARVLALQPGIRPYALVLLRAAEAPDPTPLLALALGERASHLHRRIAAMTDHRPTHRLPRALAAGIAACALLTAACDVLESPGARARPPGDGIARVVDEGVDRNGRTFRHTDNGDGTETVELGPDPRVPRGWLGFGYKFDDPGNGPIGTPMRHYPYVARVDPGSPAEAAGLVPHDTILSSNGKNARLGGIFPDRTPGTVYTLRLRRNGVERDAQLTVGPEQPPRTR